MYVSCISLMLSIWIHAWVSNRIEGLIERMGNDWKIDRQWGLTNKERHKNKKNEDEKSYSKAGGRYKELGDRMTRIEKQQFKKKGKLIKLKKNKLPIYKKKWINSAVLSCT